MDLSISEIFIKNFKGIKEIRYFPHDDFNIIIGENNIGKSTIFEAIQLWEKCYTNFIQSNLKSFYKVDASKHRYVNYDELDFLRIQKSTDLFHTYRASTKTTIGLKIKADQIHYNLEFNITRPTSIDNAFFRVQTANHEEFRRFSEDFVTNTNKNLTEAIFIYQTRPLSSVRKSEPYFTKPQIKKKIRTGLSQEVLRNKINSLSKPQHQALETSLSRILGKTVKIDLPPTGSVQKKEFIEINVRIGNQPLKELYLQGSGFIQIVEILSTIELVDAPLKVLLVDEPDSHIHAKLQKNLIDELRLLSNNQFFIISHNDQFVTSAKEGELFFLNDEVHDTHRMLPLPYESFNEIKKSLGGVLVSLELLNKAKKIVFVEGDDDESYLNDIYNKYCRMISSNSNIDELFFFPLRGKDQIVKKIDYNKRILSKLFKNKNFVPIFDKDFSSSNTDKSLYKGIRKVLGNNCQILTHDGYCIESVLFSDIDNLKRLLLNIYYHLDSDLVLRSVDEVIAYFDNNIDKVSSPLYQKLKNSFDGQMNNNRPEFVGHTLDLTISEWVIQRQANLNSCSMYMSKKMIKEFIYLIEEKLNCWILRLNYDESVVELSDEDICHQLMMNYINHSEDIYESYKNIFEKLEIL